MLTHTTLSAADEHPPPKNGREGNREIVRTLTKAAMVARTQKVVSFRDSLLYAGLNAEG